MSATNVIDPKQAVADIDQVVDYHEEQRQAHQNLGEKEDLPNSSMTTYPPDAGVASESMIENQDTTRTRHEQETSMLLVAATCSAEVNQQSVQKSATVEMDE